MAKANDGLLPGVGGTVTGRCVLMGNPPEVPPKRAAHLTPVWRDAIAPAAFRVPAELTTVPSRENFSCDFEQIRFHRLSLLFTIRPMHHWITIALFAVLEALRRFWQKITGRVPVPVKVPARRAVMRYASFSRDSFGTNYYAAVHGRRRN
jgi:hypothetical protein